MALPAFLFERDGSTAGPGGRDLRLDLFRGLALVFIFVNHIPENALSWASNRYYGFSDATEIFVFISGYSAALAYGGVMARRGFLPAAAHVARRIWQIYVAHIFVFVLFVAQIAYVATGFNNPLYAEEMGIAAFLGEPHVVVVQALTLRFKPVNMDILPLYIVLLAAFPVVLWMLRRFALPTLLASVALYVAAARFGWNLPAFPGHRVWVFNPFCWQFLFVIGAFLGLHHGERIFGRLNKAVFLPPALLYLAFSFAVVMTWNVPAWEVYLPNWLERLMYPVNKTNLDILRLLHFAALAYVTVILVKPESNFLHAPVLRPLVLMGQHSLHVFCAGVLLSFVAHFAISEFADTLIKELAVNAVGLGAMVLLALLIAWYRAIDRKGQPA